MTSTHKIQFALEAIRNMKQTGSVWASSRFLVNQMLDKIDFSKDLKILELGAGSGVFTYRILDRMSENSQLVAYEMNDSFVEKLRENKSKNFVLMDISAEDMHAFPEDYFDVVVSSLPLSNLPKNVTKSILVNIKKHTKTEGIYLQYQYSKSNQKQLSKFFGNCEIDFCLLNIPPAFIYKIKI